jgi:hypothetical protein
MEELQETKRQLVVAKEENEAEKKKNQRLVEVGDGRTFSHLSHHRSQSSLPALLFWGDESIEIVHVLFVDISGVSNKNPSVSRGMLPNNGISNRYDGKTVQTDFHVC